MAAKTASDLRRFRPRFRPSRRLPSAPASAPFRPRFRPSFRPPSALASAPSLPPFRPTRFRPRFRPGRFRFRPPGSAPAFRPSAFPPRCFRPRPAEAAGRPDARRRTALRPAAFRPASAALPGRPRRLPPPAAGRGLPAARRGPPRRPLQRQPSDPRGVLPPAPPRRPPRRPGPPALARPPHRRAAPSVRAYLTAPGTSRPGGRRSTSPAALADLRPPPTWLAALELPSALGRAARHRSGRHLDSSPPVTLGHRLSVRRRGVQKPPRRASVRTPIPPIRVRGRARARGRVGCPRRRRGPPYRSGAVQVVQKHARSRAPRRSRRSPGVPLAGRPAPTDPPAPVAGRRSRDPGSSRPATARPPAERRRGARRSSRRRARRDVGRFGA
jgi:hypothetical protein